MMQFGSFLLLCSQWKDKPDGIYDDATRFLMNSVRGMYRFPSETAHPCRDRRWTFKSKRQGDQETEPSRGSRMLPALPLVATARNLSKSLYVGLPPFRWRQDTHAGTVDGH